MERLHIGYTISKRDQDILNASSIINESLMAHLGEGNFTSKAFYLPTGEVEFVVEVILPPIMVASDNRELITKLYHIFVDTADLFPYFCDFTSEEGR